MHEGTLHWMQKELGGLGTSTGRTVMQKFDPTGLLAVFGPSGVQLVRMKTPCTSA